MKKRATIKDIARETGLSIATVSRVINKKEGHYNEETKNSIEDAIKKLKYKPHIGAINLKKQKTMTIGFVAPELDSFYNEVYLGSQDYAFKHKYSTFLFNTNYNKELEELQVENLLNRRVDGVILASGLVNNNLVYKLLEDNVPVVSIENIKDDSTIPAIILDNYKYSKLAVKHLIDKGYKRIGYLSGPTEEMYILQERYKGYTDGLKDSGIELDKRIINFDKRLRGEWDLDGLNELIAGIISGPGKPDALFIISDVVALIAIRVITKLGYKIPEEIGIMGFDDRRMSKNSVISLSSVFLPKYEMGRKGMELLINNIEGNGRAEKNVYLDMKLSIRESTSR
jgi:DNA-binding LacI/PurR family transcriptional regulator